MMAREEYIRVYRSDQPNATPSLTAGEIAANLVDGKFFVGGTNGSLISFNDITRSVASVAVGASSFTGAVSITNGSNVTISTANNRIAISASVAVGATGYTIVSGIGSGISSIAGNIYSINNLGVTSFNGSTGAVSYYPPFATASVTGVASFPASFFSVSNGVVSLSGAYASTLTGDTVGATGSLTANTVSGVRIIDARLATINSTGVASFDTNNFTVSNGAVSIKNNGVPNAALANSSVTVSALGPGLGGGGSVALGSSVTLTNLGVTGISANTNSGITISGTTGQVVISNSGVTGIKVGNTTLNGNVSITNGTYSTVTVAGNQITVDLNASSIGGSFNVRDQYGVSDTVNLTETLTFTGSPAIAVSGSNNQLTFFNTGVTSFNGQTGAVSYYPPFATQSVTGVASFNSTDFGVVSGAVSSRGVTSIAVGASSFTGAVSITNGSNVTISTANNRITINAVIGATGNTIVSGIAAGVSSVAGNTIAINNLGVTSFNGLTGAVSYYPPIASIGASGVASFRDGDFDVSITGAVSLDAVVAKTNTAQTFTALQTFSGGITGSTAHFRTASIPQIGSEQIGLSGDGAGIYFASGNDPAYQPYIGFPQRSTDQIDIVSGGVIRIGNPDSDYPGNDGAIIINDGVLSIQSINTINGAVRTVNQIGNNVTINGGLGIRADTGATTITIHNLGVTSFNGSTGAVSYYPPFATASLTGVASFPASFFSVANGVVSLSGAYASTLTGDTVGATGSLTANTVSGVKIIDARLATASLTGVASFPASFFSVANGVVSLSGAYASTLTGDTVGATGSLTANTVSGVRVIDARLATINSTGVASFDTNNFTVSNGAVSIKVGGVTNAALANSSFVIRDGGNSTNSVSLGDILVITGGTGVVFKKTSEDNFEIYSNFTINGTPPVGNDFTVVTDGKLSIPLASYSVTGVASFNPKQFTVDGNGRVGLSGAYDEVFYLNGINGNVSLTAGIITDASSQAIRFDVDNKNLLVRLRAAGPVGVPGIASFQTGPFSVDSFGHVDLRNAVQFVAVGASSFTGTVQITNGSNITISTASNRITISAAAGGATGDTVGATGALTANTVSGVRVIDARLATISATGVASFSSTNFDVANGAVSIKNNGVPNAALANSSVTVSALGPGLGGGGSVSLGSSVTLTNLGVTSVSTNTNSGITISGTTGQVVISNSGVTGFRVGGTLLTGTPSLTNNSNITRSGINLIPSGQDIAVWNAGVTSLNGLTGARTLTGDFGAIRGVAGTAITARTGTPCGTTGVVGVKCGNAINVDVSGLIYLASGNPCDDCRTNNNQGACEGAGCYWCSCNSTCYCEGQTSLCPNCFGTGEGFFSYLNSGFGASSDSSGALNYMYLDVDNLNNYTGSFTSKTDNYVVFFDSDEAGLVKTKKASLKTFFLNNLDTLIESKTTSQFSRTKGSDTIEFRAVLGSIQAGEEGLVKGATAFEYISKNTVASVDGCTGAIEITGTVNEVTVTTSCPTVTIGLPDNVQIPYLSVTGATFAGSVKINGNLGLQNGQNITSAVTTFNGASGAVSYYPAFASASVTGVASFDTASGLSAGATGHVRLVSVPNSSLANSSFTLRDEVGGTDTISLGDTLTITGGLGVDFLRTGTDTYQVRGITATSSVLGVASFNATRFSVVAGAVDLAAPYQITGDTVAAVGSASATRSGSNVTIDNRLATTSLTGVASFSTNNFDVTNGAVTIKTGGVPNAALANSSFILRDEVGLTDTISLGDTLTITGGRGVDFIRTATDTYEVRGITATSSVLGVASFNSSDFTVSSGAVSLTNAARTNTANTFTGLQTFTTGITSMGGQFHYGVTFGDFLSSQNVNYFRMESDVFTLLNVLGSRINLGLTSSAGVYVNNDGESTVYIYGNVIGTTGASFGGNVTANKFIGTIAGGSF